MKLNIQSYLLCVVCVLIFQGCSNELEFEREITQEEVEYYDVIIVGAGASGLSAAKLLEKYNKSYLILEASSQYGGRMKQIDTFSDFPIDLGAEWIHHDLELFKELTLNQSFDITSQTILYNPQELYYVENKELENMSELADEYIEFKFKNTTWFSFFEKYMITNSIRNSIQLNSLVTNIDYKLHFVEITTLQNKTYYAKKVLVTVPISVLQKNYIKFNPKFSNQRMDAIHSFNFSPGLKAFLKFEEKFYPDLVEFKNLEHSNEYEEKTFYDAAFKKDSQDNILGVLVVGNHYNEYKNMSEDKIIENIVTELDELFENQASKYFEKGIVQHWSKVKYIEGAYVTNSDELNVYLATNRIKQPIENKVYFSGSIYNIEHQSTVTGAILSAYETVEEIVDK